MARILPTPITDTANVLCAVERTDGHAFTSDLRLLGFATGPDGQTEAIAHHAVLIRDRDAKFSPTFDRAAQAVGARVVKTAVRAPDMNAVCERFLGSVRRECLDQMIVFSEAHLRAVLREYVVYFNASRPHQGLRQNMPGSREREKAVVDGRLVAVPVLGGLHHDYRRAA